jgi:hypothetical protein
VEDAERDAANARFNQQVSIATLMNVLGKGYLDKGIDTIEKAKMISTSENSYNKKHSTDSRSMHRGAEIREGENNEE